MKTITEKMEQTINEKQQLTTALHKKLNQLTSLEIDEKTERADLMSSDLSDKIEGKITEKAKVAYCDKTLKPKIDSIEWLENDITKIKNQIGLCNDKISLYKYTIMELELSK